MASTCRGTCTLGLQAELGLVVVEAKAPASSQCRQAVLSFLYEKQQGLSKTACTFLVRQIDLCTIRWPRMWVFYPGFIAIFLKIKDCF